MQREFTDWQSAFDFASAEASRRKAIMQLRKSRWYGKDVYIVNRAIQNPRQRFGVDAQGEFVIPEAIWKTTPTWPEA